MNQNFKVVFSKARGALMVVNELTSSVQAKGTMTVIAAAVASLVAGGAMAADHVLEGDVLTWTDATSSERTDIYSTEYGNPKYKANTVNITNGTFSGFSNCALVFGGTQKITIKDTTVSGSSDTAQFFNGHNGVAADNFKTGTVLLDNVTFKDNSGVSSGGAMYIYDKVNMTVKGGSIVGNKAIGNGNQVYGGAVVVKSGKVVFEDVLFQNNVAENTNRVATGGAILVDITTGIQQGGKNSVGDVTFKITKDMAYTGNNVIGNASPGDTYGWYAYTSGGFLFLDRTRAPQASHLMTWTTHPMPRQSTLADQ